MVAGLRQLRLSMVQSFISTRKLQVAPVCLGLAVKQKVRTDHPNRQLLGRPGRLIAVWMTVLLPMDMAGGTDGRIGRTSRTPARAGPDAGGISAAASATVVASLPGGLFPRFCVEFT